MSKELTNSEIIRRIYVFENLNEIIQELENRDLDQKLSLETDKIFSKIGLPSKILLQNKKFSVLSRSIATPNLEQLHFLEISKSLGLTPIIFEYDGKFVTKNKEKFYCSRMCFMEKNDKTSKDKIDIIDINKSQGKNLKKINTLNDQGFFDFHHELFDYIDLPIKPQIIDFTKWFNLARESNPYYYFYFLCLFLKKSILFDNYILSDKYERPFIVEKILPSISSIKKRFDKSPLIFPLVPIDKEDSLDWLSYPINIKKIVEDKIKE